MIDTTREIKIENVLAYNERLYNDIHAVSAFAPLTRDMMKIALRHTIEALNKTTMARKRLFYEKCLELC